MVLACVLAGQPAVIYAEATQGKTMAEKLEEALTEGTNDQVEETVEAPDENELATAWENLSAGQIITGIKDLDEDNPDKNKVRAIRKSYEKLSAAEKARVNNIDRLVKMEELLKEEPEEAQGADITTVKNENSITSGDHVKGRSYTFALNKQSTNLTLVLSYTTDDNNDGLGDTPDITLTFPDGTVTELTSKMTQLSDRKSQLVFLWQQNYMQIDVAYGMEGNWTIDTTVPVTFSKSEYRGDRNLLQPIEETPKVTAAPEADQSAAARPVQTQNRTRALVMLIGMFIAMIAGVIAFVIFLPKLLVKSTGTRKEKNPEVPLKRQMTEEEEMALMMKTLQDEKKKYKEQDREVEEQNRKQDQWREVRRTEPISETLEEVQNNLDADDSVEESYLHSGDTDVLAHEAEQTEQAAPQEAPTRKRRRHFE